MTVARVNERAPVSRPLSIAVIGGWAVFVASFVAVRGVPFERLQVIGWIVATLTIVTLVTGGALRQVILDWLPLAVLLLAYDLTRGAVDTLGMPVQIDSLASADSALFGGHVPTVWLQQHLYRHTSAPVSWWEAPVALVYASHFVVPYLVGAWHWTRGRERWLFWLRRFVGVTAVGLVIYTLVPAAPPWLASRLGVIGEVDRTASRGWSVFGLDIAERVLDTGQASVNLVAAMPSLHAAHAALVVALFWEGRKALTRLVLVLYPLSMGGALVLTGEHYVVDILAGFAVVVAVCAAVGRWERTRLPEPPEPPAPAGAP